ncbi:MAG: exosortase Y-associated Wzy-like protein [Janthinobacterium lividum]
MLANVRVERYFVLYLPWIFSWLISFWPQTSYLVAWSGSFFIFYITMSGWVKPIPTDRTWSEQLMRPLFLTQLIFAGYMCCSTVFYYLDTLGYYNFHLLNQLLKPDQKKLTIIAECQRYYCLGHAAFVSGIVLFMNYPVKKKYFLQTENLANLLLYIAVLAIPVSIFFTVIPGLSQFSAQFNALSFIAATLSLAFAIPQHKMANILISGSLFGFNFYNSFLSGYKEPIIVSLLVLAIFLYPLYKRTVILVFGPLLLVVFMLLPTYNSVFRENAWSGDLSAEAASKIALDATFNSSESETNTNWDFLIFRLSEIDMFTKYTQSTPKYVNFYGMQMINQSFQSLIPRVFWPSKPNTENMIMERVYNAGVVAKGVNVSAKPALIADAYLFEGGIGIFIILFIYGAVAQLIALKSESLFGGYVLGTAIIYSGLFQMFWRGLSFEFLVNSVIWSYVSMLLIARLMFGVRILQKAD